MNVILTAAGAFVLSAALVGCGDASRPRVEPDVAASPTWGGCQEIVGQSVDYVAGATGERTVGDALAPYRRRHDHVVVVPRHDHRARRWLLVDDDNVIHTSLEASRTDAGWLVDDIETCSR